MVKVRVALYLDPKTYRRLQRLKTEWEELMNTREPLSSWVVRVIKKGLGPIELEIERL